EADDVLADVQWVIQSEKGMVLEPQVTIGDRTCWFRTSIQPVRDSDGVPYAALLHASDITERKLVEQEIHRQNAILQQSHDLIALSDLDGVITYINQGGADMAEVGDPQLILGRKLTDFHPPEDARRIMEEYIPAAIEHGQWRGEAVIYTASGQRVDADQTIFPIREADGEIKLYATIIADITERKQAEEARRRSEVYLRSLVESQTAFSVRIDINGNLSYHNQRYKEAFGWYAPSLIGIPSLAMVLPEDHEKVILATTQCIEDPGKPVQVELRKQTQDGGFMWTIWEFIAIHDASGHVNEVQCMGFDITRQKLAEAELQSMNLQLEQRVAERTAELKAGEEALRASEERYRTLITTMSEGIVLQGRDGAIHTCNEAAAQILGLSMDQLLGRTSADSRWRAVHEDGSPFAGETHPAMVTLSTGEPCSDVIMGVYKPDGELRWISINSRPVFKPGQKLPEAVVVTFSDVSQRIEAEQALERALQHEKELGELKSRFVSMTSHEYRTPLAAILATTETLSRYRSRMDAAQVDERLDRIRTQVMHMKGLVEDVSQLERIQAGRMPFKPEETQLDVLCLEIIEEVQATSRRHDRIAFDCPQRPVFADIDVQLMRQIIANILTNALKYSTEGQAVRFSLTQDDETITLSIADRGIGIPEEDMAHLFDPFHRGNNVGVISGTGLGLSIAKQALKLHNGSVEVNSRLGEGATFTISLPNHATGRCEHAENPDY
ncbi:MAG: PAS domain S-box protein, partial [Caldilineaceae bacterium]|nr:PAS domain S-box protein [Caldilineaceae bacterium]